MGAIQTKRLQPVGATLLSDLPTSPGRTSRNALNAWLITKNNTAQAKQQHDEEAKQQAEAYTEQMRQQSQAKADALRELDKATAPNSSADVRRLLLRCVTLTLPAW